MLIITAARKPIQNSGYSERNSKMLWCKITFPSIIYLKYNLQKISVGNKSQIRFHKITKVKWQLKITPFSFYPMVTQARLAIGMQKLNEVWPRIVKNIHTRKTSGYSREIHYNSQRASKLTPLIEILQKLQRKSFFWKT